MTLSPTAVFWTSSQGIYSCPLGGCGASPAGPFTALGLTYKSGGTMAYWNQGAASLVLAAGDGASGSEVFSMPPGGGSTATVANNAAAWTLENYVYWFDGTSVQAIGIKTGAPRVVMSNVSNGTAVAADGNNVYLGTSTSLLACPKASLSCGSSPLTIASTSTSVIATEPDAQNVYFASVFAIYRCPYMGCPDPSNVTPWTGAQGQVGSMVADANALYWTDTKKGTVLKCAHGASCATPTTIASGLTQPQAVAIDDTWVYWTLGAGSVAVQRAPK
jgi:hypothetical protein